MSQKFRIKNNKGLFIAVNERSLVTAQTIEGLRRDVLPTMPDDEQEACSHALDAFAKLPLMQATMRPTKFDDCFDATEEAEYVAAKKRNPNNYRRIPTAAVVAHGWLAPEAAKAASKGEGIECPSPEAAGWLDIRLAANFSHVLNTMLSKAGCPPLWMPSLEGASTAAKRAKELIFEPIDDFAELASTEMWMLFYKNGFVDDKGSVGPLARARMFQSAVAASKTANARGLSNWKVVRGAVELKGLEDFPGDAVPDKLANAISMREGELIREALQSAGVDALRARLAELEKKVGEEEPKEAAAPSRRSRL